MLKKTKNVVYRNRGKNKHEYLKLIATKIDLIQNINLYNYIINPRIKMAGFKLQITLRNRLQIMYAM